MDSNLTVDLVHKTPLFLRTAAAFHIKYGMVWERRASDDAPLDQPQSPKSDFETQQAASCRQMYMKNFLSTSSFRPVCEHLKSISPFQNRHLPKRKYVLDYPMVV
ncbi:predicted protein [Plenodomus lingam JN3]|uniref:Predicted protein n=1 Tax=Leptosphaeria maculans (strain JN3 / isolate v23.1.3 / race Av1-4-5-6-7-8) TaxID=985895 RepID=E4ZMW0_LEPMJ|nr:predicted protein [Plenodomus lingam JN3]CBX92563.1 predicted protein [Plenodomus lingam JN3]